jgi:spore maturation protein CgeB
MARNRMLYCHTGFSEPLRLALEARGVASDFADPDAASVPLGRLDETLACVIWFYEPMRTFGRLWRVAKLKRLLARHGVPLFAWNQDAPHYLNRPSWRLSVLEMSRLLDIYASHTLIDTRRQFAGKTLYLANAADTRRYHPMDSSADPLARLRDPASYRVDVSFFGGMDGCRYKEDQARADFFGALAEKLNALAISHDFREAAGMSTQDQVAFIQSSRINLNFGARCEYGGHPPSGLPERCYGIPACGGFLLCDQRTHARDDFTPGVNWAEFSGVDDCVEKIQYWLGHFDAARTLAERCHRHVLDHHTYSHRAQTLHQAVLDWHALTERG